MYLLVNTPLYFFILILSLFSIVIDISSPYCWINEPGLNKLLRKYLFPITSITNGAPIGSPFILTIAPAQLITVDGTILCPLILIASAPMFFISFTIARKSPSCTKSLEVTNLELLLS